jgi:hypothetical protein
MKLVRQMKMCLNETCSTVCIGKCLSDSLPIQKWSKTRCFITTAFQLCFRYAIRKVQENQVGLKLNGIHQFLAYSDDLNLLGHNLDAIRNRETVIDASKEVGLEINVEKTKYMLLSHNQNVGQNRDIKIANKLFKNVSQLGTTVKKKI